MNYTELVHHVGEVVLVCSVLHTVLPPWDALNDFPKAQKYYKLVVYIVGYIAINARSTVYKGLSTQEGTKPSLESGAAPAQPPSGTPG